MNKPLADLLRPQTLAHFVGQSHLVGPNGFVSQIINSHHTSPLPSLIFWGPPGSGKTTLARIIASELHLPIQEYSAVTAKKADLQRLFVDQSKEAKLKKQESFFAPGLPHESISPSSQSRHSYPLILFLDEIHRFSKAQQDILLGPVERGEVILVAATTENPSFTVISPLLSRCRVLVFNPLTPAELGQIVTVGLQHLGLTLTKDAFDALVQLGNGDARTALNLLQELSHYKQSSKPISKAILEQIVSSTTLRFDRQGDQHYDTISAFIKSMRASQPDAALYYLARMIESGEDPRFVARRMVVFASEDIGLSDPHALALANEAFRATETIGLPEIQITLAHVVCYLAEAPKNRSTYDAYFAALDDVKSYGNLPIPLHIRNAPTKLMKDLGYGKNYQAYTTTSFLPTKLQAKRYFKP